MRILAVDPGEKYIGLAICDPLGLIARPLATLRHEARPKDAERIVSAALESDAEMILVGQALNTEGEVGTQARRAERLAEALRAQTSLPVQLHDESYSTQTALAAMRASGKKRSAQRQGVHSVAAAAILQSYLDAHAPTPPTD